MMKSFFLIVLSLISVQIIDAWISQITIKSVKKQILEKGLLASVVMAQSTLFSITPANAFALNYESSHFENAPTSILLSDKNLIDSSISQVLKQPTESQPQIMLPKGTDILQRPPDGKNPILQGLVYLRDPQNKRPEFSDNLVITVTSSSSEQALAGARIPVTKVRFPSQFNLYKENILPTKTQEWESAISSKNDLFVNARICPEYSTAKLCSDDESTFQARGISKVVKNLPGMKEGDIVRTAASLGL